MKRRSSILVIEPSDTHFEILCQTLTSANKVHIVRCRTWTEGGRLVRSKRFELVLTEMKGMGGHQGLEALVHFIQSAYPVPVIILTTEDDPDNWVALMKAGAQDVWVKKEKLIQQLPALIKQKFSQKKAVILAAKDNPLQRLLDNLKGLKNSLQNRGKDFASQKGIITQLKKLELEMKQIKNRMFS